MRRHAPGAPVRSRCCASTSRRSSSRSCSPSCCGPSSSRRSASRRSRWWRRCWWATSCSSTSSTTARRSRSPTRRLPGCASRSRATSSCSSSPRTRSRDYIKRCVAVGRADRRDAGQGSSTSTARKRDRALRRSTSTRRCSPASFDPARQLRAGARCRRAPLHDGRQPRQLARQPLLGPGADGLVKGRAMFLYWSWDGERRWPRFHRILTAIR